MWRGCGGAGALWRQWRGGRLTGGVSVMKPANALSIHVVCLTESPKWLGWKAVSWGRNLVMPATIL